MCDFDMDVFGANDDGQPAQDAVVVEDIEDNDDYEDYEGQPMAFDVLLFHAALKRQVQQLPAMDDQIRCYIKAAYHLYETTEQVDDARQLVRYIFRDLKRFPIRLLRASFEAFPYHYLIVPFDNGLYNRILAVFLEVVQRDDQRVAAAASMAGGGGSRKRSFES
jgi:hypothetical protein